MTSRHATTVQALEDIAPLPRREAVQLGRVEYQRFVDDAAALAPEEWDLPTDCEGWVVRDVIAHLAGAMLTATSMRRQVAEQVKVARHAKRTGLALVDAMTAVQIAKVSQLSDAELVETMSDRVEPAATGRSRVPGFVARAMRFQVTMNTIDEKWTLDYLLGTILTRDTWLHRVNDVGRATGRAPALTPEHDGRIVADIAAEWARRHGEGVELTLTGPAGGRFRAGNNGPDLTLDAVDFCRILSRRAPATHPLLETEVPF